MRVVQPLGSRGSLKWIQMAVNRRPRLLAIAEGVPIRWLSPLKDDDYAEYRDESFLRRLGLERLTSQLKAFWPARGPQWDALSLSNGAAVLVEAKAHLDEFFSPASAAKGTTRQKIEVALGETREALNAQHGAPWIARFYQYANRLAHLHFLRREGVDAHLLLVSFLNDPDVGGLATPKEWEAAYRTADYALGLPKKHALTPYVHHRNIDVAKLG